MYEPTPALKTIKCKECNADVKLNASYPITEVTCNQCHYLYVKGTKDNGTK